MNNDIKDAIQKFDELEQQELLVGIMQVSSDAACNWPRVLTCQ